jgi:cell division septation protein DedD
LDEISGVSRDSLAKTEIVPSPNRAETTGAAPRPVPQEEDAKDAALPEETVTLETPAPLNAVPEMVPGKKGSPPQEMDEKDVYSLQVGFFGDERNAIVLSEQLKKKGYDAFILRHMNKDRKIFFRVLVGRFHEKREAVKIAGMVLRKEKMTSIIFQQAE